MQASILVGMRGDNVAGQCVDDVSAWDAVLREIGAERPQRIAAAAGQQQEMFATVGFDSQNSWRGGSQHLPELRVAGADRLDPYAQVAGTAGEPVIQIVPDQ